MKSTTAMSLLVCCLTASASFADMLVADYLNRRVMRFSEQDGSLIDPDYIQFGGSDGVPFDIAQVGGEIWITDAFGQIVRYSLDGQTRLGAITGFDGAAFGFEYVPAEDAVFVATGQGANDVITRVSVSALSITGSFPVFGSLDVARSGGSLLISDEERDLIYRFAYDGTYLGQFADSDGQAQLQFPCQMVTGVGGSVTVGCAGEDSGTAGVAAFGSDGSLLDSWHTSDGILGLGALENGTFLVTLNSAGQAAIFDPLDGSLTPVGPGDALCFFVGRVVIPAPATATLLWLSLVVGARRRRQ